MRLTLPLLSASIAMHISVSLDPVQLSRAKLIVSVCAEVALYGKKYIQAAKDAWRLLKNRGIDALVNGELRQTLCLMSGCTNAFMSDSLVGNIWLFGSYGESAQTSLHRNSLGIESDRLVLQLAVSLERDLFMSICIKSAQATSQIPQITTPSSSCRSCIASASSARN